MRRGYWEKVVAVRSAATNAFTSRVACTRYEAYLPFDELA
jgi:hypothetical protein